MTTLATIGAGKIGSNVARAAIAAGYDVILSNSRGPESLTELVAELGPQASAATPEQAAAQADLVLVAVPLDKIASLPADALAGKIVMDATNYHPSRYGNIPRIDRGEVTTSRLLQEHAPDARVVKAFNTITAHHIPRDASPPGTPNRRALPIAGDDPAAKAAVADFLSAIGFDAVDIGGLDDSWVVERDTPAYGPRVDATELRALTTNVQRVLLA
jgi:predicted dinucleotide-binding enzyme